jgi:molybdopterin molybdotransferase
MLELEQAVTRILDRIPAPVPEPAILAEAGGRILAQDAASPIDLPPFDNSAMDGYAVRAEDVASVVPDAPVRLRITGRLAAGETFSGRVRPGEALRLFTGSPVPDGADAVVMQEDTRVDTKYPGEIVVLRTVPPGENIRPRGEDVKAGAQLCRKGDLLTAGRLSFLAAAGVNRVQVGRRPTIGLCATGSELKEPGSPLLPGHVYESNRVGLAALVRNAGAIPKMFPLVPDSLGATRSALTEALEQCDVIVTSGGVSVGELDFVKAAFEESGGTLEFWRVAIKPGRPFVFGRRGEKLLFGLPGNPVSALVTFMLLVRPGLLRWQGAADVSAPTSPGIAAEPLVNPGARRHFMRVRVDPGGRVFSAGRQGSHLLRALAAANALADIPPETTVPEGTPVKVIRWE